MKIITFNYKNNLTKRFNDIFHFNLDKADVDGDAKWTFYILIEHNIHLSFIIILFRIIISNTPQMNIVDSKYIIASEYLFIRPL